MEIEPKDKKAPAGIWSFAGILALCVTAILCVFLLSGTLLLYKRTPAGSSITATGSASLDFESDLIVWSGNFSVHGDTLETAYEKIHRDSKLVRQYLLQQQISESDMSFGSVAISKDTVAVFDDNGNYVGEAENGYTLSQIFTVSSRELDKVSAVSKDISELIASGVELESENPKYYYTKLDELKMQLISDASANAKQRIDLMAKEAGAAVGDLTSASLGVFQITAANSGTADYGATGSLNTSARYKTAMITVRLNYMVE